MSEATIELRVLGTLEILREGQSVALRGPRQRTLLALLASHANQVVSTGVLLEGLWGSEAVGISLNTLQALVARLRRALAGVAELRHEPAGYVLVIDAARFDVARFETAAAAGRRLLAAGDAARAELELTAALAVWRGAAYADAGLEDSGSAEPARLEELRLQAVEARVEAVLLQGGEGGLIAELRAMVAEHPLRERLREQLMLALYRSGRQAEALETFRTGRRLLVEELGLDPGPRLRRLERMVLTHDPALSARALPGRVGASIPVPLNPTVGRSRELQDVRELLERPDVRLVSLLGTGGAGKTRLAYEAAGQVATAFPGGLAAVSLGGLEAPASVIPTVAQALGFVAADAPALSARLRQGLRGARLLVVLDGLERLLDAGGDLVALLESTPGVTLLVTSRAALRVSAEWRYDVRPLEPESAAVLLCERARSVQPEFALAPGDPAVVEVCRRLDGLPLAIELAAEQLRLLDPATLVTRLEHRLEILVDGPRDLPPRQRSLRAALDWSWDTLTEDERALAGALSVFAGGASLQALGAVAARSASETLMTAHGLLDKSLVRGQTPAGEARLDMLDMVREYAGQRAGHGGRAELERRHAAWFADFAQRAASGARTVDRRAWLERQSRERDNLRVAFRVLLESGQSAAALGLAVAVARSMVRDSHGPEVRAWIEDSLVRLGDADPALRAEGLEWSGRMAVTQAHYGEAADRLRESVSLRNALGDRAGSASALVALASMATLRDDPQALALCEEALAVAQGANDRELTAEALFQLSGPYERQGDWHRARALSAEALALFEEVNAPEGVAGALCEVGWYELLFGRLAEADALLERSLSLRRQRGDERAVAETLVTRGWLEIQRGDAQRAAVRFDQTISLARHVDEPFVVAEALAGLSTAKALEGDALAAARLAGASATMHARIDAPPWPSVEQLQERVLSDVRERTPPGDWAFAWTEGGQLSLEQARNLIQARGPAPQPGFEPNGVKP